MQQTLIVQLDDGENCGYGEATTNPYYGMTLENMRAALESVRPTVEAIDRVDPERLWAEVAAALQECLFALCALDQAACDLWGKQQGAPVYQLWGLDVREIPLSNFTIAIDSIDVMVEKLREVPEWPIYKIKLGTPHDLEIVRELREQTDAVFRVDANCGWTAEETIANSHVLASLGVEFIEQPLPAGDWEAYRRVFDESVLPILADESCITEGGRGGLSRLFSRDQHQAGQVWRAHAGAADDCPSAPTQHEGHGRVHDRVDCRHLSHSRNFCRCSTTSTWTAPLYWPKTSPRGWWSIAVSVDILTRMEMECNYWERTTQNDNSRRVTSERRFVTRLGPLGGPATAQD